MKNKAVKQIVICAGILVVLCIICRITLANSYTFYYPLREMVNPASDMSGNADDGRNHVILASAEQPGFVHIGEPEIRNGYAKITIRPEKPGKTDIIVAEDGKGYSTMHPLRIGRFLTVYDSSTGGFTGDNVVLIAVTVFCLLVSLITLHAFREAKGPGFYSYYSVFYAGGFLFSFATFLLMLTVTWNHLTNPRDYIMLGAYTAICGAAGSFMLFTFPLILLFAAAMIVSNIELLRHESPRLKNLLGILIGVLLMTGEILGLYLKMRSFAGSELEYRFYNTFENVYATCFAYIECMLAGAVICGIKAARHNPPYDRDYIVILGCYFRKDGSLPPLLKGRVDRALEFWKRQKDETGKEAVLIPSGGQGANESMPEAEAMSRYLVSCGFPEHLIRKEDQSRNTYQNMEFSRALIERESRDAKTAFSTTNYHVFRSGVWAGLAGLPAEGMGSRTKWWYWPNAFMRECVGLLQNRLKQEILLMLFFTVLFGVLSMLLT